MSGLLGRIDGKRRMKKKKPNIYICIHIRRDNIRGSVVAS